MVNELQTAFNEIAEMRALPPEVVLEALQSALVSAYRRDSGASSAQQIEARIDPSTGRARIFVEKEVAEDVFSPSTEVTLEKARFYEPEAQLGDMVMVQVENTTKKFGRIAAQTAKQVILQKIREAERNALYEEFINREGDLVTGTVQSVNSSMVTLSLGRAEAILPRAQQIPRERYRQHEKLRVYLMEVKRSNRGPQIVFSRSHRNMLRRLLEYEVPEIYNGQVEIKSIAREAGYRSKVAVAALQEGIDPVGACVGMRGIRIQNIVKELHDEKIDVIEWNSDPKSFIDKALSPARVTGVYLEDEADGGRTAVVVVPDDQLSLAIGREGQNARLAAKLTGWRIDIKSVSETVQQALENMDMPPLDELLVSHTSLVTEVVNIIDKKQNNRTVMPEEYTTLAKFADLIERKMLDQREELRQLEQEQIEAVRATLPEELFELPLFALPLPQDILDALEPLENVGEVMLASLTDESRVRRLVGDLPGDSMEQIQSSLDMLMESGMDLSELVAEVQAEAEEEEIVEAEEAEGEITEVEVAEAEEAEAPEATAEAVEEPAVDEADDEEEAEAEGEEVLLDAFGGVIRQDEDEEQPEEDEEAEPEMAAVDEVDDDEDYDDENPRKSRKSRQKKRQLVFDEETGEVVAKRRRKSNRKRDKWDDYDY